MSMKNIRKIDAMHHFYGIDPSERVCIQCDYLIWGEYNGKRYYKCKVYGCSHSEATDWRKSYTACGLISKPFPDGDKRIVDVLKHSRIKKTVQVEGQIGLEDLQEE